MNGELDASPVCQFRTTTVQPHDRLGIILGKPCFHRVNVKGTERFIHSEALTRKL